MSRVRAPSPAYDREKGNREWGTRSPPSTSRSRFSTARVAQSVEHTLGKGEVIGSIPIASSEGNGTTLAKSITKCEWRSAKRRPVEIASQSCRPAKSGRRGSNPRHQAWKACALPAELLPQSESDPYQRDVVHPPSVICLCRSPAVCRPPSVVCLNGGGRIRTFEGISRQIYSLLPLATWVPHPADPRAIRLCLHLPRADGEDRTRDRPITNRVLYQLSYVSETNSCASFEG